MEGRKELKITATVHNQLGKQITEVRGSEEGKNNNKKKNTKKPPPSSRQSEVFKYIRIKTSTTICNNICNNQIARYYIHMVKSICQQ